MLVWYGLVHGLQDVLLQTRRDLENWSKSSAKLQDLVYVYLGLLSDQLSADTFRECVYHSLSPFIRLIFEIIHRRKLAVDLRNCTFFDLSNWTNRSQIHFQPDHAPETSSVGSLHDFNKRLNNWMTMGDFLAWFRPRPLLKIQFKSIRIASRD